MKKRSLYFIGSLVILFFSQTLHAGASQTGFDSKAKIKRTYTHSKKYSHKRSKTNINYKSVATGGIEITYQDFINHFTLNTKRTLLSLNSPVLMDIKGIDDNGTENQIWEMPNFNNLPNTAFNVEQVPINSNSLINSFPNATHMARTIESDRYDVYQLTENELFYYGFGFEKNEKITSVTDYYSTLAPLPLKWGLGFTGVVTFIYDTDQEIDSTQYVQIYDVVAQGVLKTFDDGDADAVKAIFKELELDYKDGVVIAKDSIEEIVWYSTRGHYIRAEIEDAWNNTGQVELSNMQYQKINQETAGINDENINLVKTFPNPINAGETLTIESKVSLNAYRVHMYNINGLRVSTLNFSESTNNQYQIAIPEKLSSGVYFYKMYDKNGNFFTNGKIQIK